MVSQTQRHIMRMFQASQFRYVILGVLLLGLFTACADDSADERAVARVGTEAISKNEVEEFAAQLLPGLRSHLSGYEARRDYLQTLIDEKLLVMEAQSRGIDTTRQFVEEYEKVFRKKVVEIYRQQDLYPRVTVTEDEIKRRFHEGGYDREKALNRLVVKTEEEALQLRKQWEQGAYFSELAKVHSIDPRSAPRGGYLGFISRPWASHFYIPLQVFDSLKVDEVSSPLAIRGAYQLFLVSAERNADIGRYRRRIHKQIWKEKIAVEQRALAEELAYKFDLELEQKGLKIIVSKPPGRRPVISSREAATPLFVFAQGEITVGNYLEAFYERGTRPPLGDSLAVVRAAWQVIIPDIMFWEDARRQGYHETGSILDWGERKKVELLIKALRRNAVGGIRISDEEAKDFYYSSPNLFQAPVEIWIQEILLADLEQATQVRQRLDAGEDINDLAQLTQRPEARRANGKLHIHSYEEFLYGDLVPQAIAAEPGQIVGPVATQGSYSVFQLLEKVGGQPLAFAEVEPRVKAILRYRKEDQLFNVLVRAIREKYADQVRIFENVLREVKLPDETVPAPGGDALTARTGQ